MSAVKENGNAWTKLTSSLYLIVSFRGIASVLETRAPFREPKVDTKLGQQCGHPLWVPMLFVVNWFPFWGLRFGHRTSPCFVPLFESKQIYDLQSISPCAMQITVVKDVRFQTIVNIRSNILVKVFLARTACRKTSHW